ncbi:hypothetical protein H2203_002983 [Taxawa tesnikishii (nom. ined.)]|nr:hypothetical protein H2203_002983 [Dothideales sp. JES 119]
MFDSNFSYASSSPLPSSASPDAALSLLHDFGAIITLNPDCKGFTPVDSQSDTTTEYKVEEALSFIPKKLWDGSVYYQAFFTVLRDGCDILIKAPGGFQSTNHWKLKEGQDGRMLIEITSDGKCNKTFASFVKKFVASTQPTLQRAFAARLQEKQRPGMGRRRSSW